MWRWAGRWTGAEVDGTLEVGRMGKVVEDGKANDVVGGAEEL